MRSRQRVGLALAALALLVSLLAPVGSGAAPGAALPARGDLPYPAGLVVAASIDNPDVTDTLWLNITNSGTGVVYSWTWLPPGCASSNTATLECTVSGGGGNSYRPTAWATGGLLNGSGSEGSTTVDVAPAVSGTLSQSDAGSVEIGASITYSVTPAGGTGVYRISYDGLPAGCLSSNSTTLVCSPATPGMATVSATVKDSLRPPGNPEPVVNNASSTPVTTHVLPAPSVSAAAIPTATDQGYAVQFNATTTGGIGANGFWWGFGDGGLASTRNPVYTYSAAGTYNAWVFFNDSQLSETSSVSVTVSPTLGVTASASPNRIIVGQSVGFNAGLTGGTSPVLQWRFGDGLETSGYGSPTHAYNSTGTFTAAVWANDSVGARASSSATVDVAPPLAALAAANTSAPDAGIPVQFNGTASGGFPAYSWSWRFATGGAASALRNPVFSFPAPGTFIVGLWVNDSNGDLAHATVPVTVSAPPLLVSVSASPSSTDVGFTVDFHATTSGGTSPAWLNWSFGDGGSGTGAAPTHAFSAAGTYVVRVWFNDSDHLSNRSSVVVAVNPALKATAMALPSSVDPGVPVQFNGTQKGGTWSFTYAWTFGASGGTSSVPNPQYVYAASGTYTATLWVNDSVGASSLSRTSVIVSEPLSLTAGLTPVRGAAPLTVTGSATTVGGTPSVSFLWIFGDGTTSTLADPAHTFPEAGVYPVVVFANDSGGGTVHQNFTVVAIVPLVLQGMTVEPNGTHPGTASTVAVATSGGVPPLSYTWTLNGSSFQASGASFSFVPRGAGNFTFAVTVLDSAGQSVEGRAVLQVLPNGTVAPPPTALAVALSAGPSVVLSGGSFWLNATAAGGSAPYSFTFYGNESGTSTLIALSSCAATSSSCLLTRVGGGNYTFYVQVEDSDQRTADSTDVTVQVRAASTTSKTPSSGNHPILTVEQITAIAVVGLVAVLLLIALVALSRRRRKGALPGPEQALVPPQGGASMEPEAVGARVVAGAVAGPASALPQDTTPSASSPGDLQSAPATLTATAAPGWDEGASASSGPAAWSEDPVPAETAAAPAGPPAPPTNAEEPLSVAGGAETAAESSAVPAKPAVGAARSQRWPTFPLTFVETKDHAAFWNLATKAGLAAGDLLLLVDEPLTTLREEYPLDGAPARWITREEGEDRIAPADVDRMGYLVDRHFEGGPDRAVVITGTDRILAAVGVKNLARFVDHVRDSARARQGAVLILVDPEAVPATTRRQLEERAQVIRLVTSKRAKEVASE